MDSIKGNKNSIIRSILKAKGDIHVGDKQTIHIYGKPTNLDGIDWGIKVFISALILFLLGSIIIAFWVPEYLVPFIICGLACLICIFFLVLLIYLTIKQSPPSQANSDEI